MTDLRKLFEEQFPVQDGVVRDETGYIADFATSRNDVEAYQRMKAAERHNHLWIGFQAGYKAAKEGK